jgi:hypothetical protein
VSLKGFKERRPRDVFNDDRRLWNLHRRVADRAGEGARATHVDDDGYVKRRSFYDEFLDDGATQREALIGREQLDAFPVRSRFSRVHERLLRGSFPFS